MTRAFLAMLVAGSAGLLWGSQGRRLPESCSDCTDAGKERFLLVELPMVSANIVAHRLPQGARFRGLEQREPWVLFVIMTKRQGPPCDVTLARGSGTVAKAVVNAIKSWTFRPFLARGKPVCCRIKMYVYLKNIDGSMRFIIPGLTNRMGELLPEQKQVRQPGVFVTNVPPAEEVRR